MFLNICLAFLKCKSFHVFIFNNNKKGAHKTIYKFIEVDFFALIMYFFMQSDQKDIHIHVDIRHKRIYLLNNGWQH